MSRMADLDATLSELAERLVHKAAEAIGSSAYGFLSEQLAHAAVATVLRELDEYLEAERRDFISQVRLRDLADYISEGGRSDVHQ